MTQAVRCRSVECLFPTDPLTAYAIISDVVANAAFSDELIDVWWESRKDPSVVSVGDTFSSKNGFRAMRWTSTSVVIQASPGRRFAFAVSGTDNPTAIWTFDIVAVDTGSRVTYTVQLGDGPSMFSVVTGGDPTRRAQAEAFRLDSFAEDMQHMLDGMAGRLTTTTRENSEPNGSGPSELNSRSGRPTVVPN